MESIANVNGWCSALVGDVSNLIRGISYSKEQSSQISLDGMSPILRANNIASGLQFEDLVYVVSSLISSEQFIRKNDILFAMSSGSKKHVGKSAIATKDFNGSFGAFCGLLRVCPDFNAKYLSYFFQSSTFRRHIEDISKGTNINNLKREHILDFEFPVPPISEQKRIVAKIEELFSELDNGIECLKAAREQLKIYRQAILKYAIEGKLTAAWRGKNKHKLETPDQLLERIKKERRAKWEADLRAKGKDLAKVKYVEPAKPDIESSPELPEGWVWARAEQLCDFITKGTTPAAEKLHSEKGEVPFIKVYNLTDHGFLDFRINPTFISKQTHCQELSRSKVFPGDILMNIVGPPLGKVSIVPDLYPEWNINQAIAFFRPMPGFDRKFLCFALLTDQILFWAERRAKATAGQFNLTLEICRDLPLPLPPVQEQEQIVAEVEQRLSVVTQLETIIEANQKRAERLRQSVLKDAFVGRLVSQDPNDESASVLLERIRSEKTTSQAHIKKNHYHKVKPANEYTQSFLIPETSI